MSKKVSGKPGAVQNFGLGNPQFGTGDLRIGNQPLSDFPGAKATILRGPDPAWPANVDTIEGSGVLKGRAYTTRRSSAGTTRVDFDFIMRSFEIDRKSGKRRAIPRRVEIGWRRVGVREAWTRGEVTLKNPNAPADAYRRTIRVRLPAAATWQVRVRRFETASTADNEVDEISWTALRSFQPDTADYTGQTRVRLRLPASVRASGQLPVVHAIAHQPVPAGTTADAVPGATSNPAWIYLAFLRGQYIQGRLAWLLDSHISSDPISELD